ncbi:hypothetical protein CXF80_12760 [Shewanella sp. Actino-trap-3]|jgi:hypothetical protein|uniref:hypothetical protein n=1 Tax=Shewanella sp. Actino-trap-3 TaxID=2058331 RepID=UPI000C33F4BD|nr:hypothetical protein [Shewanella sp. Actino-trap-3]PKG79111.1 hypothetical protein CXF80_12760 [Shewanella sp. Actino-trap-3]|tara:strand:+ start:88896 stop:89108 length:213 start_codon:yes stop_codon:yes gene_type:complete
MITFASNRCKKITTQENNDDINARYDDETGRPQISESPSNVAACLKAIVLTVNMLILAYLSHLLTLIEVK